MLSAVLKHHMFMDRQFSFDEMYIKNQELKKPKPAYMRGR
jgi:hypothetical protein